MQTPFWFVVLALVACALVYRGYGRWGWRRVWRPDPNRQTPAHLFTDGQEYVATPRAILWGFHYAAIAPLAVVLGPLTAAEFGWAPALAWLLGGSLLAGWMHDYGAVMISVRHQGRSLGAIADEWIGPAGRLSLLSFLLFYLLLVSAALMQVIGRFWQLLPGSFAATMGMVLAAVLVGRLLHRTRLPVAPVTVVAMVLAALCLWLAAAAPAEPWGTAARTGIGCLVLFLAAVLPMPWVIQPLNYLVSLPAVLATALILAGALLAPVTGVRLAQPAWTGFWGQAGGMGFEGLPLWPVLFAAGLGGAVSGWRGLVAATATAKQLDNETDAFPVGVGAMLAAALLGVASLAAWVVLSREQIQSADGTGAVAWLSGVSRLTGPLLGGPDEAALRAGYGRILAVLAFSGQALVTRCWRLTCTEVFGGSVPGHRAVATAAGLALAWGLGVSGIWRSLWLYLGGADTLLAALTLLLITVYLARKRAPSAHTLVPGLFLLITALATLAWQTVRLARTAWTGPATALVPETLRTLVPGLARGLDWLAVLFGLLLLGLGLRLALLAVRAYRRARAGSRR